ncbi:choice-of-anchor V domain-containing protein [Flavilitoribacter nigricans]|uniref:Uncharacterized protein n=1 Tax=Flavilitoribacter nigricans (strain ATCC 23147 / DSM 23189 / NBRC 102662 / NCIMB 1420 / SS-2) TaxID=1122177 RepID=A0A2D0NIN4_FLAN2|nr:choice-of-anchor V domain-containing protein [Flavilitoribacter nigricans]PHN08307.1 hypothetical protein CRP01_03005 [Flavilitoribacter nigricans DSM 23189 = NBRC 102662]
MKIRMLYTVFSLIALAIIGWNASDGPAKAQKADRTMSPLSNNSSCSTCHTSGSYSPALNVQLLDGEAAVTTYEPGKTYTLRVAITGADDAAGYGFQSVLLYGDDNLNAGTFGAAPSGMQVTPLNDRMYAEHSARSNSNVFTIDWTAPAGGLGDVRIYAGGNAVNGNGSVSGDVGTFLSDPLVITEAGTSNVRDQELTFDAIRISPNPTRSGALLSLDNSRPGRYLLTVYNAVGQLIEQQSLDLVMGEQSHWIDLDAQPRGLYFLRLTNGQQQLTRKILKQ